MTDAIAECSALLVDGMDCDLPRHEKIIGELAVLREKSAKENDELKANEIWRIESMLRIRADYISVYEMLKNGQHMDAWIKLERIEILIQTLKDNSDPDFHEKYNLENFEKFVGYWQSLFPYKMFISPAMIIGYKTCSICGHKIAPRSRCTHKKGYLHNGVVCYHMAHDIEILEVSLVTNPVQKYSVIGDNHDHSGVDYVIERLNHPLEVWIPHKTIKELPREVFKKLTETDRCPCASGDNFSACCWGKDKITIPHIQIEFFHPLPPELAVDLIPYQD